MALCRALEVRANAKRSPAQRFDTTLLSNSYSPSTSAKLFESDDRVAMLCVCRFETRTTPGSDSRLRLVARISDVPFTLGEE
jgi:hypothetical protein